MAVEQGLETREVLAWVQHQMELVTLGIVQGVVAGWKCPEQSLVPLALHDGFVLAGCLAIEAVDQLLVDEPSLVLLKRNQDLLGSGHRVFLLLHEVRVFIGLLRTSLVWIHVGVVYFGFSAFVEVIKVLAELFGYVDLVRCDHLLLPVYVVAWFLGSS